MVDAIRPPDPAIMHKLHFTTACRVRFVHDRGRHCFRRPLFHDRERIYAPFHAGELLTIMEFHLRNSRTRQSMGDHAISNGWYGVSSILSA
jgi:hypothetical protein